MYNLSQNPVLTIQAPLLHALAAGPCTGESSATSAVFLGTPGHGRASRAGDRRGGREGGLGFRGLGFSLGAEIIRIGFGEEELGHL